MTGYPLIQRTIKGATPKTLITMKQIEKNISADSYDFRDDIFTLKRNIVNGANLAADIHQVFPALRRFFAILKSGINELKKALFWWHLRSCKK